MKRDIKLATEIIELLSDGASVKSIYPLASQLTEGVKMFLHEGDLVIDTHHPTVDENYNCRIAQSDWHQVSESDQAELSRIIKMTLKAWLRKWTDTTDTKTDTKKKNRKKRELSSAGASCAIFVRQELEQDDTANRKQLIKDWAESKNGVWDGEKISVDSIYRQLTDNPESWRPKEKK